MEMTAAKIGIKEFLNQHGSEPEISKVFDGTRVLTNAPDIANAFNLHFSKVNAPTSFAVSSLPRCSHSFYLSPVSPHEISQVVKQLKCTGSGLDNIRPFRVKLIASDISIPLAHVVNLMFRNGGFPDELKKGKVVPVFKKGDRTLINNYRPITIRPFFSKVIEKLLVTRLTNYLNKFNLLTPYQFGFRPNFSSDLALIEFTDYLKHSIDLGFFAGAVFVDFSKAFDTINHAILYSKLDSYGICGPTLTLIRNYLLNRSQVVLVGDSYSKSNTINQGVPQGSILGPLLFLLYINDLPKCLNSSRCILYADDTTIFSSDSDLYNLLKELNKDAANIVQWCRNNQLVINPLKTTFMLFHSPRKIIPFVPHLTIDAHVIHPSDATTFLGVTIDSHLKFDKHIAAISSKISFGIRVLIKTRTFFPLHILRSLYFAFIHSHLTYCSSSWGNTYRIHLSKIAHLQNKAIRIITFSHWRDSATPIFSNLGILPIHHSISLKLAVLIFRARQHDIELKSIPSRYLINANLTRFSLQHSLLLPVVHSNYGKQTVLFSGIYLWNLLPKFIKSCRNITSFKVELKKHLFQHLS